MDTRLLVARAAFDTGARRAVTDTRRQSGLVGRKTSLNSLGRPYVMIGQTPPGGGYPSAPSAYGTAPGGTPSPTPPSGPIPPGTPTTPATPGLDAFLGDMAGLVGGIAVGGIAGYIWAFTAASPPLLLGILAGLGGGALLAYEGYQAVQPNTPTPAGANPLLVTAGAAAASAGGSMIIVSAVRYIFGIGAMGLLPAIAWTAGIMFAESMLGNMGGAPATTPTAPSSTGNLPPVNGRMRLH